jgi:hypothetical protein
VTDDQEQRLHIQADQEQTDTQAQEQAARAVTRHWLDQRDGTYHIEWDEGMYRAHLQSPPPPPDPDHDPL